MGCLNVNIARTGGSIETAFSNELMRVRWGAPEGMHVQVLPEELCGVNFSRVKEPFSASFGLVCPVGVGKWEYLMCSDRGFVRTFDKGYILVRKG